MSAKVDRTKRKSLKFCPKIDSRLEAERRKPSGNAAPDRWRRSAKTGRYFGTAPNWTAPHVNQNIGYLRGNETVSGKALAAGSAHHRPAARALPLTKVRLSN